MKQLDDVREFIEATRKDSEVDFGILPEWPFINSEKADLCIRLIREECCKELCGALESEDIVEIADGIIDSIYVILFTAVYYGIPVDDIWDVTHAANMAKRWEDGRFHHDAGNKVIKPPGWKHPDIKLILQKYTSGRGPKKVGTAGVVFILVVSYLLMFAFGVSITYALMCV